MSTCCASDHDGRQQDIVVRRPEGLKRAIDFVLAAASLTLLAPVIALVAFLVAIESEGPVWFRQRRVGLHGNEFVIFKFRTMTHANASGGPLITAATDRRITRIGKILRHAKLDELPQLVNVLFGDMSIVGPRPEVPIYVSHYRPEDRRIVFTVRPGLTDFATLLLRDEQGLLDSVADADSYYRDVLIPFKVALAKHYAMTYSVGTDARLVALTIVAIVSTRFPLREAVRDMLGDGRLMELGDG